jgi:hypothetical protein
MPGCVAVTCQVFLYQKFGPKNKKRLIKSINYEK